MVTIDELADTILRYIAARPNACDTIDGVCQWWIPRQRYIDARNDVLAALELLTARGELSSRTDADGQVLYRAPRLSSS
jgi:hypothetical protein